VVIFGEMVGKKYSHVSVGYWFASYLSCIKVY
jgi:hypothetical protein